MINILFAGNDKVFDGMLTCGLSILKRTTTDESFVFYIMTMDVSRIDSKYTPIEDAQINFLSQCVKKYNDKNEVIKIDVSDTYEREFKGSPNEDAYCSPYTLIRLFADMYKEIPDKILYLDVDVLFNNDITTLYEKNIEGYEYAGARDHYGKFLISPNYVNAGVLLLNMQEIRKTKLLEKSRELIKTKKLVFADQSAIRRSTTKRLMLQQKFNDQKYLHKNTVIRHFSKRLFWLPYPHTANIKQWDVEKVHSIFKYHEFDDILNEYLDLKKTYNQKGANE